MTVGSDLDPRLTARIRRAVRRGPRYIAWRIGDAVWRRAERPWECVVSRVFTDALLLREAGSPHVDALWSALARTPFFISSDTRVALASAFAVRFPGATQSLCDAAERILRHEFDLLGSGPRTLGRHLPWHDDFKTGRRWPVQHWRDIEYLELDRPTDVKVPWELSRCQHFTTLGRAYWLTGDERFAREFVDQVSDWIANNPYAHGVNWACVMDVALRAVSWIWGFHFFAGSGPCADRAFRAAFLRVLYLHGEFVAAHLERGDVNGNHYLCDGVGLVFLGCFFGRARRAASWRDIGCDIVLSEIHEQVSADGVDFEQSTAYHRLVLEAFAASYQLLKMNGLSVPPDAWERLERMHEFVAAYSKPDGRAPLIGDADDGRVQILGAQPINDHRYLLSTGAVLFRRADFKAAAGRFWEDSFWLTGRAGAQLFDDLPAPAGEPKSVAFSDGGFYVLRGVGTHVVIDCGEVGMRGRGGHGHNDILGFELFMCGFNVVTDCGAYLYTASRDWRNRFRSTAFHNTVSVDDEELNRFVGPDALWQLRYDAQPIDPRLHVFDRVHVFTGGHAGYQRLVSPVTHVRRCYVDQLAPRVFFEDSLSGAGTRALTWRFHLDPAVVAETAGDDVRMSCGGREVWLLPIATIGGFDRALERGWVSPSYGVKTETTVVVWRTSAVLPLTASFIFAERQLSFTERGQAAGVFRSAA